MIALLSRLLGLPRRQRHPSARYYAATKAESKLARRKAIDRQLELAVAVCHLTPEEREAAKQRGARMQGRVG